MLIGHIRPNDTRTLNEGEQLPAGWEYSDEKKRLAFPTGPVEEIEADDMDALRAKVPSDRILLSVRAL
ncbi:hypothetical protein ACTJJ4_07760 [Microbacterium sp. 22195]|uniref:hypothetical protein n=1 Tax=Microbacterium sp. 22195 TaxID=3453891 RepID=UPI003F833F45